MRNAEQEAQIQMNQIHQMNAMPADLMPGSLITLRKVGNDCPRVNALPKAFLKEDQQRTQGAVLDQLRTNCRR